MNWNVTGNPSVEFKILGCALSNLTNEAYPLAVVFNRQSDSENHLDCYILHNWQNYSEFFPDETRGTILDLLEDLKAYPAGEPTDRFFNKLSGLNFGYIRILAEGDCEDGSENKFVSLFFQQGEHPVSWPESFTKL